MKLAQYTTAILLGLVLSSGTALATDVPLDRPMAVGDIETVCTGAGIDVRADPKWRDYSLRLEFVGMSGQYLGDEQVSITGNGQSIDVHCVGPWVLMKLPKGDYQIAADVADAGHKVMTARIPAAGQAHVIIRFPNAGGEVANAGRARVPGPQASR